MEMNQVEEDSNNTNVGGEEVPGAETDETMQMEGQVHTTTVLDEQSLQQLMDSGTVSEDRYFVWNQCAVVNVPLLKIIPLFSASSLLFKMKMESLKQYWNIIFWKEKK